MNGAVLELGEERSSRCALRKAEHADVPGLVQVLADSFSEDPFISWIVGSGERRRVRLERLFEITLQSLSSGLSETYTVEGLSGCAVWKHSDDCKLPWWRELALVPAFCAISGVRRIGALLRAFAHLEALHAEYAPESHYYLHVLGVTPSQQGRGLGHSLLQPAIERFDREGKAAYLETFRSKNLAFYERHGFRVVGSIAVPPLPAGWVMRRDPA